MVNNNFSQDGVRGPFVVARDPMKGYDELDPSVRELIQQAPLSIDAATALNHQRAVGVARLRADIIAHIEKDFPGYTPPMPRPGWRPRRR